MGYTAYHPTDPISEAMRVVHLVQFFEPGYVGGTQRYVAELALQQQRLGLDVSILTVVLPGQRYEANGSAALERSREYRSLPVTSRKSWGMFLRTPIYPLLPIDVRRLQTDVVHIHGPSPWFEAALMLARPLNGRLVLTLHSVDGQ